MRLNIKSKIIFIKKHHKITVEDQKAKVERNKYVNVLFEFSLDIYLNMLLLNKKSLQEEPINYLSKTK
jgi:hypothetical protein